MSSLARRNTSAGSLRLLTTARKMVRLTAMNKAAGTPLSATSAMIMPHSSSLSGTKS